MVDVLIWGFMVSLAVYVAYFSIQPKFVSTDKLLGEQGLQFSSLITNDLNA